MMARISNTDSDRERAVPFLLNGQPNQTSSPNGSTGSGHTVEASDNPEETLSTSRDTESSVATPTRPLITHSGGSLNHPNGGHIGLSQNKVYKREKYEVERKKKKHKLSSLWKGKEHLCCLFGTVTFLLGAIFFCIATILFLNSRTVSQTQPCSSALSGDTDSTISSPLENSSSHLTSTVVTSTSTEPTTTFNYDELVNIAAGLESFAYQSSTQSEGEEVYSASRAVDGDTNYTLSSGSCSLTEPQLQPFWWLDMKTYKLVKRIRIFKPSDCCDDGLTDFEVRIGQQEELSTNALCKHFPGTNLGHVVEVVCERQIYGRYLSIQLLGTDAVHRQLALCEVEVYEH